MGFFFNTGEQLQQWQGVATVTTNACAKIKTSSAVYSTVVFHSLLAVYWYEFFDLCITQDSTENTSSMYQGLLKYSLLDSETPLLKTALKERVEVGAYTKSGFTPSTMYPCKKTWETVLRKLTSY